MEKILGTVAVAAVMLGLFGASQANGQGVLLARGTLTESSAGLYADLSGLNNNLENGAPANLLAGLASLHAGIREHVSRAAGPRPECSELRLSGRRHGQLHTEVSLDHDGAGTQCGHGFAVHADSEAGKHYVVVQRITSCLWQWRSFGGWPRCAAAKHFIQELFFWAIG